MEKKQSNISLLDSSYSEHKRTYSLIAKEQKLICDFFLENTFEEFCSFFKRGPMLQTHHKSQQLLKKTCCQHPSPPLVSCMCTYFFTAVLIICNSLEDSFGFLKTGVLIYNCQQPSRSRNHKQIHQLNRGSKPS